MNTRTTNVYQLTNRQGLTAQVRAANADEAALFTDLRGAIVRVELMRPVPGSFSGCYEVERVIFGDE